MIFVSASRAILIYLLYGLMDFMFVFIGYKVFKRGKNITNTYMGTYFIWAAVSLSFNIIYTAIDIPLLTAFLNDVVVIGLSSAQVFLLIFILIIRHSQAEINKMKQIIWIGVVGVCEAALFISGLYGGVVVQQNTSLDWVPVFSLPYAIAGFVITESIVIYIIFNGIKVRKSFTDKTMRRRFTWFLLGAICFLILFGLNYWANLDPSWTLRLIYTYVAIIIIPGSILIYLSLGKEVTKNE